MEVAFLTTILKMKIAIDTSPIELSGSGHKVRGVGKYINLLKDSLPYFDKTNTYVFTSKITKEGKIDLLHFPYFDPFFVTFPLVKRIKTLITVHDVIPLDHAKHFPVGIKGRLKWSVNKLILRNADAIITDSEASRKKIRRLLGYPLNKIHVAYLAVDKEFQKIDVSEVEQKRLRKEYGLPERFFMYVGDVTWNKNLPRLVDAVNSLKDIHLVMVGKALKEKEFDRLNPWNSDRVYVEKHANSDKFHKLGFIPNEDLVKLYNMAEALITPSLDEGFGLPALEAMSCGCPVIISREGSLPEVGGGAALYVDAYSTDDIAEKMKQLYKNSSLHKELSKKSLQQSKKFSLEKMAHDTIKVYKSI